MAVRIAPVVRQQFFDDNGDELAGGFVLTEVAGSGSATPLPTFTSSTGATPNANPITLNSRGETPSGVWLTAGLSYKFTLKRANGTVVWTEDGITGVNDSTTAIDEWAASGLSPSALSSATFSVPGDQTTEFHVGRRLRTTLTAGTGYHTITSSSFSAGITTVGVSGTAIDSGLTSVSLGILRAMNTSIPAANVTLAALTVNGNTALAGTLTVAQSVSATIASLGSSFANEIKQLFRATILFGSDNNLENKWSIRFGGLLHYLTFYDEKNAKERMVLWPELTQSVANAGTWDFFVPVASKRYLVMYGSTTTGVDKGNIYFVWLDAAGSIRLRTLATADADLAMTASGANLRITNTTGVTQAIVADVIQQ